MQQLQFGQTKTDERGGHESGLMGVLVHTHEQLMLDKEVLNGLPTRYGTTTSTVLPGLSPWMISSQCLISDKAFFETKGLMRRSKDLLSVFRCSFDVWGSFFRVFLADQRKYLISNNFALVEVATSNMITDLSVGQVIYQEKDLKYKIKVTGTQHLLAVSGMHLSIVLGLTAKPMRTYLSKRWLGIWSFCCVLGYLSLVEPSYSLVRAGLMASINNLVSQFLFKQYIPLSAISLSFIILIFFDLSIITSLSFQMSFAATTSIILSSKYGITRGVFSKLHLQDTTVSSSFYSSKNDKFRMISNYIFDSVKVGLTVQMLLLPLVMYHFGTFSWISIVATVFVSWLIPILIPISIFSIFSSSMLPKSSFILQLFLLPSRFFSDLFIGILTIFNSELFLVEVEWFSFWHLIFWWFCIGMLFFLFSKKQRKLFLKNVI